MANISSTIDEAAAFSASLVARASAELFAYRDAAVTPPTLPQPPPVFPLTEVNPLTSPGLLERSRDDGDKDEEEDAVGFPGDGEEFAALSSLGLTKTELDASPEKSRVVVVWT